MSSKVSFTSVELISFSRSQKQMTARFEFSLTQKAMQAMGWGEIPMFQHGCDLDGDLAASVIELIPSDALARKHAVQLDTRRVFKFVATRQEIEGKRGKGQRWSVQCDVVVSDGNGCKKLEQYMASAGKCEMRVSYEPQAVQEELPTATEEQRQAVLEDVN